MERYVTVSSKHIGSLKRIIREIEQSKYDLAFDFDALHRRLDTPPTGAVRISNVGLLNAGKSTLFNALCGIEDYFATSDARCTTEARSIEVDGYILIDTPGLDANTTDDALATHITQEADLLLFVHDIESGEFDRQEADFLEQLPSLFPDAEILSQAVLPVFTHCEGYDARALAEIVETTTSQWAALTGVAPEHTFTVRSSTYFRGLAREKPRLCEFSGIPALDNFVRAQREALRARRRKLWWQRIQFEVKGLRDELDDVSAREFHRLSKKEKQFANISKSITRDLERLKANIKQMYRNYESRKRSMI